MTKFKDRVKDTTTTTGTGTVTLSGTAPAGYQAFGSAFATSTNQIPYVIAGETEWEVGFGTLLTATTLRRDKITDSSNSGSAVNFSAGAKDVWCDLPAFFANKLVGRGHVETMRFGAMTL